MKKFTPIKWLLFTIIIVNIFGFHSENKDSTNKVTLNKFELQLVDASSNNDNKENKYDLKLDNHSANSTEAQTNIDFNELKKIASEYLSDSTSYNGAPFVELFEKTPDESFEEYLYRLNNFNYQNWLNGLGYFELVSAKEKFYTVEFKGTATDEDLATQENFQNHLKQSEISSYTEAFHEDVIKNHIQKNNDVRDSVIDNSIIELQYQILQKSFSYQGAPYLDFIARIDGEKDYDYMSRLIKLNETPYELTSEETSSLNLIMPDNQIINQYEKWLIEEKGYQIRSDGKFEASNKMDDNDAQTNVNAEQLWENYLNYHKTHFEVLQDSINTKTTYYAEQNNFIATKIEEIRSSMEPEITSIQTSDDGRIGVLPKEFMTDIHSTEKTVLPSDAYDIWTTERQDLFQRNFHEWSINLMESYMTVDFDNPWEYYGLSLPEELFTHMKVEGEPQSVVYKEQVYQGLLSDYYLVLQIRLSYSSFSDHEPNLFLMTVRNDGEPIVLYGQPELTEGGTTLVNFEKTSETDLQKGWEEVFVN